jgi:cellulose synthase/poly-beta-1,6-N-acetylglucosamine synthase-like glycosyltransferase
VDDNEPSVTVLIAARPEQAEIKALTASRALEYPADKLEIIVTRGKQPSAQRNAGMKKARGELIYFLDDDSEPRPESLRRGVSHFTETNVKIVGGPNLCPSDAPALEQVFALVLRSWLAFGPSRARYAAVGKVRETGEKELILCNLIARREVLLELGGFNEALYPNEENALMDELQKRGGKLVYDPELIVYRRPRRTLKSFARMLKTYGRGRAEQFRLYPTLGSALNFAPPLFCAYLAVVVPAWYFLGPVSLIPLLVYVIAVLAQTAVLLGGSRRFFDSLCAAPLIVLSHVLYGCGFWHGLFTSLGHSSGSPPPQVSLEVLSR